MVMPSIEKAEAEEQGREVNQFCMNMSHLANILPECKLHKGTDLLLFVVVVVVLFLDVSQAWDIVGAQERIYFKFQKCR